MKYFIGLTILGCVTLSVAHAACFEGEVCDYGTADPNLVFGIPAATYSNNTSFAMASFQYDNIPCGFASCPSTSTCCGSQYCCSLNDRYATCCSDPMFCCGRGMRCCGSSMNRWCCNEYDGCHSISNLCVKGSKAPTSHTVTVLSVFLPLLLTLGFLYGPGKM